MIMTAAKSAFGTLWRTAADGILGVAWIALVVAALLGVSNSIASASPEECGCRFQKARSEATVGTCAVREDMARDCDLVWGMPPNVTPKETRAQNTDEGSLIGEITQAAEQIKSPNAEAYAPGISRMSDPDFWNQFRSEVRRRSQLPDDARADLFDHSLAFLANRGATSDFRQYSVGALIFITVSNLRRGAVEPEIRRQFLLKMMYFRDRLTAFVSGGAEPGGFSEPTKFEGPGGQPKEMVINGRIVPGCFDIWTDNFSVASMVKTPWSAAKGRRCE
jgi:hypothetical protein